jgi:hypothetical protein
VLIRIVGSCCIKILGRRLTIFIVITAWRCEQMVEKAAFLFIIVTEAVVVIASVMRVRLITVIVITIIMFCS